MGTYDEMQPYAAKALLSDDTELETGGATTTAIIANGAAVSGEIDVRGRTFAAVHLPAAWTAAELGLKAATASGGTFGSVYDQDGALYSVEVAANRVVKLDATVLAGLRYIKLWSQDGSGSDANQGAARSIGVDLF